MKGKSFPVAITNFVVLIVVVFSMEVEGKIPEWIYFIFYPFHVYWVLSVFIAFGGFVVGLKEFSSSDRRGLALAGVVGNSVYFIGAVIAIGKMWPALMGI